MTPKEPAPDSFEALLAPVIDVAYGVAFHLTRSAHDAEDLVQEAALNAYRAFHQFQPGTNFKAWYLRILTNAFYGKYRKKKREPQTTSLDDAGPLYLNVQTRMTGLQGDADDPAGLVLGRMTADQVSQAIGALPDEFKVVCALYFLEDLPYQEIAGILECPVGTVRSRLHRGRRMLQKALWHVAQEHGIVGSLAEEEV